MRKYMIVAWLTAAILSGCGGDSITSCSANGTSACSSSSSSSSGASSSSSGGSTGVTVAAVGLTTSSPTILSDGSTTATITALVKDASNNLIAGVPVTYTASSGGIAVTQPTTDSTGAALATLSTAGDSSLRTITVTATAAGITATVTVQVVSGASTTSVQMGSPAGLPAGAVFTPNKIYFSSTSISAGGSATLTVALEQSDGTLYAQPVSVAFNSNCVGLGKATITSPVMTSTGIATATYVDTGCGTSDLVTATTTVGTSSLSASGTIIVAPASVGSIVYKSATYTIISLKGSGTAEHPETSTLVFQVLDQSGGPKSGSSVTFTPDTTVGGLSVTTGTVVSDANGNVQATVQAGTVATAVRVTATVQGTTPTISTQSNQLSISTGVPAQATFSVAVDCHNVEGLTIDGTVAKVTARLADRFSNPVADGTAIQFNSEGGHIQPSCTTQTTTNADGSTLSGYCVVDWVSANPRPTIGLPAPNTTASRPGRSSILAYAIGEESFVDANGNGAFDPGETWTDLPERFRDDNGNGVWDSGEFFYDFDNSGTYTPKDGLFNGVLCDDPAHCQAGKTSTGIGQGNLIIMSGSTPDGIAPASGSVFSLSKNAGTVSLGFKIADVNDNPMPSGTVVSATITGTGMALASGLSGPYTYPCTTEPVDDAFGVTIDPTAAIVGSSGSLVLSIKTPSGLTTIVPYTITITN